MNRRAPLYTECCDQPLEYCNCMALQEAEERRGQIINRTNRLDMAIDIAEKMINRLTDDDAQIPTLMERQSNLFKALYNHRKLSLERIT